jgi:hypothetical protein
MAERRGETFVMQGELPGGPSDKPLEFTTFVLGLASTALIHLGGAPNPEDGQTHRDLALARQSLDLLSLLHEKTRGNLTREEETLFNNLLADLRIRYVEATRK